MSPAPTTPLDKYMREQGRRNDWLAEQLGVSKQMVSNWRSGNRPISDVRVIQIANALGIAERDLRDGA